MPSLGSAAVLLFAAVFTTLTAIQALAFVRVYRASATRRPRDVSSERRPPPAGTVPLAAELEALGFARLGEVELTVPSVSGIGPFIGRRERHTVWVFLDGHGTTVAEVVAIGPMAGLNTTFGDGSVVETMYPRGERIEDLDFWSNHDTTTIAEAYNAHRLAIHARGASRGQAQHVRNVGDYLRQDANYRQRFARRVLRRPLIRNALIPLGVAVAIVILGTTWLLGSGWV